MGKKLSYFGENSVQKGQNSVFQKNQKRKKRDKCSKIKPDYDYFFVCLKSTSSIGMKETNANALKIAYRMLNRILSTAKYEYSRPYLRTLVK